MKRALAGLGVLAGVLLLAAGVRAKRLVAESFHSDIQVQTDGSVHVTETARFRFHGGPFTALARSAPRRNLDWIDWGTSSDPYTVAGAGGKTRVRWTLAPVRDTVRTVTLEYVAFGAVEVRDQVRQLNWPLVPRNRKYRVESATAELHWPAGWSVQSLRARGRPLTQTVDTATFARRKFNQDDNYVLRAQFSSPDPLPAAAWQTVRDGQRQHLVPIALCTGAVLLLGLGLVIAQAREAGTGTSRIIPQAGVTERPADIPPALAGAIWRGSSQWNHMVATLIDLAARGYVVVEAKQGKRWWSPGVWMLHRTSLASGLAAWERVVLEALFSQSGERTVPASRLLMALSRRKSAFANAVENHLRQQGLYDVHADEARMNLRTSAGVWAAAAVALAAAAPFVWRVAGEGALLLPLAPLIVAVVGIALASNIPRHSPPGRRNAAAWAGYREFLHKLPDSDSPPVDPDWFQHQLPYALALDAGKPWLVAAKKWPPAVPGWFRLPAEGGGSIADVLAWVATVTSTEPQPRGLPVTGTGS